MKRNEFIKTTALGAAAVSSMGIIPAYSAGSQNGNGNTNLFIGTPVLPEYLYDNGIARTLDQMKELADIDTVMTFSHDHVFRQYAPGYETKKDRRGNPLTNTWVKTKKAYYTNPQWAERDPSLKYSDRDVLDDLYQEAQKRNMKVYARILEPYVITGAIPGFESFAETDAHGRKGKNVCFNHPGYINYWECVIEDLCRSHPYLDGFKFGQERGGPLLTALGNNPGTCFCPHCKELAAQKGIDADNAREGLIMISEFGKQINEGKYPADGNFVSFLRILAQYPHLMAWEQFWMDSREEHRKRIYRQIKSINENIQVGWHIDHGMTWDLITRATWDYEKMGPYSDWLSVAVYFDSMGRRSKNHYEKNYSRILFGDADESYSYPMYLSMLGYDPQEEPSLEAHRQQDSSFSSDYVYRECKRAVTRVNGGAKVHARPGFDMPGYNCSVKPAEVYEAVTKALEAGVDGLWCGREWDELKPENAAAFGKAVLDWKKRQ